jgi:CubicO group peptidase (beta-lactamase class C family)
LAEQLRYGDPEEAGMLPAAVARMRERCAAWVEAGVTPSLAVLVARRGIVVLHEGLGRLGPEPDAARLRCDAVFAIASLTKPMTATVAMTLVEDGLLGLNRPVQEYLPDFVGDGKEAVMVHHLLTHTSGLREDPALWAAPGYQECVGRCCTSPLATHPGAEMSYCNAGYVLLGEVMRRVAGEPLPDLFRRRLFEPLGMADSSFTGGPPADRLVRHPPGVQVGALIELVRTWPLAAGAVFSTAWDVAVFGQMILNGGSYRAARVLSPASVREMTRNQIPGVSALWFSEHFLEASWGLGWNVVGGKRSVRESSLHSDRAVNHTGMGMNLLQVDPANALLVVYLSIAPAAFTGRKSDWRADYLCDMAVAAIAP